jgi:hypothetical protein
MTITSVSGISGQTVVINPQTTSYTLTSTDAIKVVTLTSASGVTLTVPTYASAQLPVGTRIGIIQYGAGQVTVAGTSGVTVNATPGLKTRAQYSRAELLQVATDTWLLSGDISA